MSSGILTTATAGEETIRFGPFTAYPMQRVLTEGAIRIRLGSRAFDILLLLERAGTYVAKGDIVGRVLHAIGWRLAQCQLETRIRLEQTNIHIGFGATAPDSAPKPSAFVKRPPQH